MGTLPCTALCSTCCVDSRTRGAVFCNFFGQAKGFVRTVFRWYRALSCWLCWLRIVGRLFDAEPGNGPASKRLAVISSKQNVSSERRFISAPLTASIESDGLPLVRRVELAHIAHDFAK